MTFVQSKLVLATIVNIRNSSAVSPIFGVFNFFGPNFLDQTFFWPKILFHPNFLDPASTTNKNKTISKSLGCDLIVLSFIYFLKKVSSLCRHNKILSAIINYSRARFSICGCHFFKLNLNLNFNLN